MSYVVLALGVLMFAATLAKAHLVKANGSALPFCTLFGVVGDGPASVMTHERVHWLTGAPWILALLQCFAQPALMFAGYGLLGAFFWAAVINVAASQLMELVADLGALVRHGPAYVTDLAGVVDQIPVTAGVWVNTVLMYPAYRLLFVWHAAQVQDGCVRTVRLIESLGACASPAREVTR